MYLYFDRNRVLKEIINNDEISVGDSGTQIYVYVEELEPNQCWVRFKLPDGSLFPLSAEMQVTKISNTTIPYNKKRDLKFFEYGKTYKFLVIDLTTIGDNAYNILANIGNVSCTIRVNDDGLKALGLVVFDVTYSTEASTNVLEYDGYVSIAQFNYLLDLMERYEDVVIQTNDISGLDPDDYEVGQVILESRSYSGIYQGTLYVVQIDENVKYFDELKTFHLKVKYLLPDSIIFGDEDNSSDQAEISYGNHKLNISVGSHTLSLNSSGVLTIDNNELATQDYVENHFVDLTTNQEIEGVKKFNNLYTKQGVAFLYEDVEGLKGTLSVYNSKMYFIDGGENSHEIAYTDYVDSAIADFLQNEYSKVNTTTYPTLNDFLASTGEEGYIYLYPIDTSDESKGYYQYIWENNTWVSLGTTQIDLSNYYNKTEVDNLLDDKANASEVYTKTETDDLLEEKANVDGNYPTMTVGSADSLTPYGENSGAEDNTPFVFQSTGGSADVGSKAYLRELRGNSVAFNQLCNNTTYAADKEQNGITFTHNQDGSWTVTGTASGGNAYVLPLTGLKGILGHKYLLRGNTGTGSASTYYLSTNYSGGYYHFDYGNGVIFNFGSNLGDTFSIAIRVFNGTNMGTGGVVFKPQLIDLTLMFGAGNEPTSVLEFNRLFPKPYYEYNAGELLSCKVNGIKNVGYNAWDEEWEIGTLDGNGEPYSSTTQIRSKNFNKCIAGQTYTLVKGSNQVNYIYIYDCDKKLIDYYGYSNGRELVFPNNACYFKIAFGGQTTYSSGVCVHLTWDAARTGYEEHEEWQYNLPNIELKSAGNAYDVLYSIGGGKRRIGVVDLGTLSWSASGLSTETNHIWYVNNFDGKVRTPNLLCVKYTYVEESLYSTTPNTVCVLGDNSLRVNTGSLSGTPTGLLYYELATETDITTEENPGWANPQDIDDFGTQEFLYDSDIAIPIPQGNDFFYPVDYKAFVDSLGGRDDIEYAADQVVSQAQLQNALSTFLSSIQGYDATKTQTLKNVSGIFQWVDD